MVVVDMDRAAGVLIFVVVTAGDTKEREGGGGYLPLLASLHPLPRLCGTALVLHWRDGRALDAGCAAWWRQDGGAAGAHARCEGTGRRDTGAHAQCEGAGRRDTRDARSFHGEAVVLW